METINKRYNWAWPNIVDANSAKKAANQGTYASIFIAGSTLLLLGLSLQGFNPLNLDAYAFIDIVIFAIIALRIHAMSQTAAILGLALYLLEQVISFNEYGFRMNGIRILITIAFINSVRGTFNYNVFKKYSSQEMGRTKETIE